MNNRKAKHIRRIAEEAMLKWYKTLVSEEDAELLTITMVKEYIPVVDYYTEKVEVTYRGVPYEQQILHVSENTQRWFYKQTKKQYKIHEVI